MANPKEKFRELLYQGALHVIGGPSEGLEITIERPANTKHGDYASNIALQLAKQLKKNPRQIADEIVSNIAMSASIGLWFDSLTIAGAGFINVRLKPAAKLRAIQEVLTAKKEFGRSHTLRSKKIQVEFVSANPTGPLHVGHGRGAAYGASLANLLSFAGAQVTREFYINDAGRQMDILTLSVWLRYLELVGADVPFPQDGYRGEYVRNIAANLKEGYGLELDLDLPTNFSSHPDPDTELDLQISIAKRVLGEGWKTIHGFCLQAMLADQRDDLGALGVEFDRWTSEQSLYEKGLVVQAITKLEQNGFLRKSEGALWFCSSQFGDEKDRVVKRANGEYTYLASDIAYHLDKFERGFDEVIDVWGADHHGYIDRIKAALSAFGIEPSRLTIALVQFAVLYRNGEKVAMGKRSGDFVTLRDLRREVGNDAVRFFYVLRKSDQHLDFDLDLARKRSNENPVYYVQYAHARVCSLFFQWKNEPTLDAQAFQALGNANLAALTSEKETAIAQRIGEFPEVVERAASELAPHSIAYYLQELAAEFHSYYNSQQILVDEEELRLARLALCEAVRQTVANGLLLLGVNPPEKM